MTAQVEKQISLKIPETRALYELVIEAKPFCPEVNIRGDTARRKNYVFTILGFGVNLSNQFIRHVVKTNLYVCYIKMLEIEPTF